MKGAITANTLEGHQVWPVIAFQAEACAEVALYVSCQGAQQCSINLQAKRNLQTLSTAPNKVVFSASATAPKTQLDQCNSAARRQLSQHDI